MIGSRTAATDSASGGRKPPDASNQGAYAPRSPNNETRRLSAQHPSFAPVLGWFATRGPHMNWFRLATSATLLGAVLATGCASPCGGCGGGGFRRMSLFGGRRACPCECCSSCGGGGVPIVGAGMGMDWGDGPILESPGGAPFGAMPPAAGLPPSAPLPSPGGLGAPAPFPPSLGTPFGTPTMPVDPGRLSPIPNGAQPLPAEPSSRIGRR